MKNFDPYNQTLYVVWGNQILFWTLIITSFQWYYIPIAIIMMYVFGCMSEISIHRYFTHKSYETTPFKEKLLLFFSTLIGQGTTLSWVAVHRSHHAYEDSDRDPHSPLFIPKWRILLGLFPKNNYKLTLISDLLRSNNRKYFHFENKYYWLIHSMIWIILGLINLNLLFAVVAGSSLWYTCTQLVNIHAHGSIGEKDFPYDVAINSRFLNIVTGAGHHNNHHHNPKSYTYKTGDKIDIYAIVIDKFFKSSRHT
jgi:stearoyl-CoA desaturase (Delta-9 desaturase)